MYLRKNLPHLLALALSVGSVAAVKADSLNGSGTLQTGAWTTTSLVVDGTSPNGGTPYWNNSSGDGPKANVGWCLTGGGSCSMPAGAPGALPYFGNGSGSASLMYFNSAGSPMNVSLQTILTTQTSTGGGYDVFGYYLATGDGNAPSLATLNPLFDSRTSTVGTASNLNIAAGQNYGFYIENIKGDGTQFATDYLYFMDSNANTANGSMPADGLQHFAAFQGSNGTFFLGDVDGDACQNGFQPTNSPCVPSSQFDYNNMIVELAPGNAPTVPEPASLALMGGGLIMVAATMKRRRSSRMSKEQGGVN